MKPIIAVIFFFLSFSHQNFAQELYSRDVIVTTDTILERNNVRKDPLRMTDSYIKHGIEIRILDTPFLIYHVTSKKFDNLNGIYLEFHLPSNMPKIKGNYLDNEKDGEWYHWNEQGKLIKKEVWKKGRRLNLP